MKITRENLVQLYGALNALSEKEMKAKAAYGIAKNKSKVESEVKSIQEAQQKIQPAPEVLEFEEKRINLCKEAANKDDNGEPITIGPRFDIPVGAMPDFEKKIDELREEYKEALDQKEKNDEEWVELMKEEIEIDIHQIHIDMMPDTITPQQIELLGEIIVDE